MATMTLTVPPLPTPSCSRIGCKYPCFTKGDGTFFAFCGRTCRNANTKTCSNSNCNQGVFIDGPPGRRQVHPFCSKNGCASLPNSTKPPQCARENCTRPCVAKSDGQFHSYCGLTCVKAKGIKCAEPTCNRGVFIDGGTGKRMIYAHCCKTGCGKDSNTSPTSCSRVGCTKSRYVDSHAKRHPYCSRECYWADCNNFTQTKVTALSPADIDYATVLKNFQTTLPAPDTQVKAIFRLQMPKHIVARHVTLKTTSKVHKMFHGTKIQCAANPQNFSEASLCSGPACGLCGIVRDSNKGSCSRFGGRMWCAEESRTSYQYCGATNLKAMFMIDIVAPAAAKILIAQNDAEMLPRYLILFDTQANRSAY